MTLVDNGWERDKPDTTPSAGSAQNNTYGANTFHGARTAASFNAPYFEVRDMVAAALAAFILLAPLAFTAFG
jgi:hypothetical protein